MSKRTDGRLIEQVERELSLGAGIPHGRVQTSVVDGVVTLDGEVEFLTQCADAARMVAQISGVRRVDDRLRVRARPALEGQVRRAVERALEQHASREARHIDLEIVGNAVKLSGRVGSWAEKQLVVGAARGTPGVSVVEEELRIEP